MFSLSWFATIPGILITGGILLLLIALIIFIVTSRKEKKSGSTDASNSSPNVVASADANNSGVPVNSAVQPVAAPQIQPIESGSMQQPFAVPPIANAAPVNAAPVVSPIESSAPSAYSVPQEPPVVMPTVVDNTVSVAPLDSSVASMPQISDIYNSSPVDTGIEQPPVIQEVQPSRSNDIPTINVMPSSEVNPEPVAATVPVENNIPVNFNVNTATAPSVEQVVPEMQDVPTIQVAEEPLNSVPVSTSVEPEITPSYGSTPVVESNSNYSEVVPEVTTTPLTNNVSIYGGANPAVSVANIEPEPVENHQIYGGANPLENTQSVSITDIANGINQTNTQNSQVNDVVAPTINIPTAPTQSVDVNSNFNYNQVPNNMNIQQPQVQPVENVSYSAQQPQVNIPPVSQTPVMGINNNFAYQTAPAPQVQMQGNNMQ